MIYSFSFSSFSLSPRSPRIRFLVAFSVLIKNFARFSTPFFGFKERFKHDDLRFHVVYQFCSFIDSSFNFSNSISILTTSEFHKKLQTEISSCLHNTQNSGSRVLRLIVENRRPTSAGQDPRKYDDRAIH